MYARKDTTDWSIEHRIEDGSVVELNENDRFDIRCVLVEGYPEPDFSMTRDGLDITSLYVYHNNNCILFPYTFYYITKIKKCHLCNQKSVYIP